MLIKFTHVDALTQVSVTMAPAANGPVLPQVAGIAVLFANESAWPSTIPFFYGQCDDDADPAAPGILQVLTLESFEAVQAAEMASRLARAKAEKQAAINAACNAAISQIAAFYPEREVQSWPQQVKEAGALAADPQAPAPLLQAIATARAIPLEMLAAKVIEKMTFFAMASGALIGQRQAAEDRIGNAASVQAVDMVRWTRDVPA